MYTVVRPQNKLIKEKWLRDGILMSVQSNG